MSNARHRRTLSASILLVAALPLLTGCVKRTLTVTSDPPGALVWLNDREVGRTPVEVEFVHYGDYDVRLVHADREPLLTHARATAPLWDKPGIDFFAEVSPMQHNSDIHWHFELPELQNDDEALKNRAAEMRQRVSEPVEAAPDDTEGAD